MHLFWTIKNFVRPIFNKISRVRFALALDSHNDNHTYCNSSITTFWAPGKFNTEIFTDNSTSVLHDNYTFVYHGSYVRKQNQVRNPS